MEHNSTTDLFLDKTERKGSFCPDERSKKASVLHLGVAAGPVVVVGIIQLAEQGLARLIVPERCQ